MEGAALSGDGNVTPERVDTLGVSAIDLDQAVSSIERWIARRERTYVCITGAHGIMECRRGADLAQIPADLCQCLFRDGEVCQDRLGKFAPWRSVPRKCYCAGRGASAVVTTMLATHRALGTWRKAVDVYIALTEFGRRKFISAWLPADCAVVKPNFVEPDSGPGNGSLRQTNLGLLRRPLRRSCSD